MGFGNVFLEIRFDELSVFFRILRESTGQIEESGINLGIVPEFQFEVLRIQIPEDSPGCRHLLIHDGFQGNFDLFDRVEGQEPELPVEYVNAQNLFERRVRKKAVIRFLKRLEITAQSEISYVFQILLRPIGIPDFESPIREQLELLVDGQTGFWKFHAVKSFDFGQFLLYSAHQYSSGNESSGW